MSVIPTEVPSARRPEHQAAYPTVHSMSKKLFGRGVEGSCVFRGEGTQKFLTPSQSAARSE